MTCKILNNKRATITQKIVAPSKRSMSVAHQPNAHQSYKIKLKANYYMSFNFPSVFLSYLDVFFPILVSFNLIFGAALSLTAPKLIKTRII